MKRRSIRKNKFNYNILIIITSFDQIKISLIFQKAVNNISDTIAIIYLNCLSFIHLEVSGYRQLN
jgi:hypothetical protein